MSRLIIFCLIVTISFCVFGQINGAPTFSDKCSLSVTSKVGEVDSAHDQFMEKNQEYKALYKEAQEARARNDETKIAQLAKSIEGKWECCLTLHNRKIMKALVEENCNRADIENVNKWLSDTKQSVESTCKGYSLIDGKCSTA